MCTKNVPHRAVNGNYFFDVVSLTGRASNMNKIYADKAEPKKK